MKRDAKAREGLFTITLVVVAIALIASVRARLADLNQHVKETSDVYALPPPEQMKTLSLGYRSAVADMLWAHVLVSQGLHTFEKRRFDNLSIFIDTINELEPTFREPYLLADALYTFQPTTATREEVEKARAVMERGIKELPLDGELWLVAGQFIAYIAPDSYFDDDPELARAWRIDGARMLARAAELSDESGDIAWKTLGGANLLQRAGKREEAIRFLTRALAVAEDPELRANIEKQLRLFTDVEKKTQAALGRIAYAKQIERLKKHEAALSALHKRDLPFIKSRSLYFALGPPIDPAACAGPEHQYEPRCAPTWQAWSERVQEEQASPDAEAR